MRKGDLRADALVYEDDDGVVLRCRDGDAEAVERVPSVPVGDR